MSRRRLYVALGVIVVLMVGVGAYVFVPRGTNAVTVDEAVGDFRTGSTRGAAPEENIPAVGVYRYAAEGEEVVKLGPLPAQTRPLPSTVTAVARAAPVGCFDWTVNLFAEHVETTTYCPRGDNLVLREHTKHQRIGALSPTAAMTCSPASLPMKAGRSEPLECTLGLSGGPVSLKSLLTGTAAAGRPETIAVGSAEVSATPVRVEYRISGDLGGSWVETTWWGPGHLPVRIERSLDISGLAAFTERSRLDLVDLSPAS